MNMNLDEIGPQLAGVMDVVSVCEGVIFAKITGEVLMGQTLTEMNHADITKNIKLLFDIDLKVLEKGEVLDYTINLEQGSLICVRNEDFMLIGLLGSDGKSSVGLLLRQLKNIIQGL